MQTQQQPQPTPIPADMPLTVTLQAQQWNAVMGALQEAPYRIAAPLIDAINQQLQQAVQAAQPGHPLPNGVDHDPPEARAAN